MTVDIGWLFLFGFPIVFALIAVYIIVGAVRHSLTKQRIHNYDYSMKHFLYQVSLSPEEIFAKLTQGEERECIRYDFDPVNHDIRFYWQGTMHGKISNYHVSVFVHEDETVLILKLLDLMTGGKGGGFKAYEEREERLDRMNDFWCQLADAQPISYYKNNSNAPW